MVSSLLLHPCKSREKWCMGGGNWHWCRSRKCWGASLHASMSLTWQADSCLCSCTVRRVINNTGKGLSICQRHVNHMSHDAQSAAGVQTNDSSLMIAGAALRNVAGPSGSPTVPGGALRTQSTTQCGHLSCSCRFQEACGPVKTLSTGRRAYLECCLGRRASRGCGAAPAALGHHAGCQACKGQRQRVRAAAHAGNGAAGPHGGCQRRPADVGQRACPLGSHHGCQKHLGPHDACSMASNIL